MIYLFIYFYTSTPKIAFFMCYCGETTCAEHSYLILCKDFLFSFFRVTQGTNGLQFA